MAALRERSEPTPPRPKIAVEWRFVGQEEALALLARNALKNRRKQKNRVLYFEEQLEAGEFEPIHQGIALDVDGFLVDGQHRVQAIANSGIGAWLLVARNVPRTAVLKMDLHARRTPADQIRMFDDTFDPHNSDVAIARMMVSGTVNSGTVRVLASTPQVLEFFRRHMPAIRFAQKHNKTRRVGAAPVRAAVARAYYYVDRRRLEEFLEVLDTALAHSDRDHAAVNLRLWLYDDKNPYSKGGGAVTRAMVYSMTVSAIRLFEKGLKGRFLKPLDPDEDPWPLPENPG